MPPSTFLRRALLYVPGSSEKMINRSSALAVDSIIYDLERPVTAKLRPLARDMVANHIASAAMRSGRRGPQEVSIRINAVETGQALKDLNHVIPIAKNNLDTIVIPKVQSAADLRYIADVVRHLAPDRAYYQDDTPLDASEQTGTASKRRPLHLIGLIGSALGLSNIEEICRTGRSLGLVGLGFAAGDFMSSLGLRKVPNRNDRREMLLARPAIANACRDYDIPSAIDMVCVNGRESIDLLRLEEKSREGRSLGFTGKQAIYPSQVGVIQRVFSPSKKWDVLKTRQGGMGSKQQKSMRRLSSRAALLHRARACGIDVDAYFNKYDN
ncbi:Pyruvate/Phosphoenolpyruvate kinase-like domain-containing protein [Xylaria cubensis]|nr:Pyruvate/Phosphoenolpyruvate kinase-like domain-containing protein [Xylaria cubensis]